MGIKHCLIPIPSLAGMLLTGAKFEVLEGIPVGAQLLKAGIETSTGSLFMTFEHQSFPVILEATNPTPLQITVKNLHEVVPPIEDAEFTEVLDVDNIESA